VTRIIAILASPAALGGICPSCDQVMDETGCRIVDHFLVTPAARQRTGIGQIVEVFCEGTPTHPVHECPCCVAHHPGAPCNRA
jgi:hypothetical protein